MHGEITLKFFYTGGACKRYKIPTVERWVSFNSCVAEEAEVQSEVIDDDEEEEEEDSDGDGDEPANLYPDEPTCAGQSCQPGDEDGDINLSDSKYLLAYLFTGGNKPCSTRVADANSDGSVNIADSVFINYYVSGKGAVPATTDSCF
jgi:hypothetical protein